jgi:hypothetical protein
MTDGTSQFTDISRQVIRLERRSAIIHWLLEIPEETPLWSPNFSMQFWSLQECHMMSPGDVFRCTQTTTSRSVTPHFTSVFLDILSLAGVAVSVGRFRRSGASQSPTSRSL